MDIILNLNKPKGITSQEAVTNIKKILRVKKAGHTGTLDPLATGVLLICINRATRLASYFSSLDKEYKAVMKLGETTDTHDTEGNIIAQKDIGNISNTLIINVLKSFEGKISQIPPIFSALKHKGKPLYEYARKGIAISPEPRMVTVYNIELLKIEMPFISFKVRCSKGTYIRTLCNDIGEKLGIGAHLFELERLAIGNFNIQDSLSIEELKSTNIELLHKGIYTIDAALSWMPELKIRESIVKSVMHGAPIKISDCPDLLDNLKDANILKIKSPDGEFLAIGRFLPNKDIIKMDLVFV